MKKLAVLLLAGAFALPTMFAQAPAQENPPKVEKTKKKAGKKKASKKKAEEPKAQ